MSVYEYEDEGWDDGEDDELPGLAEWDAEDEVGDGAADAWIEERMAALRGRAAVPSSSNAAGPTSALSESQPSRQVLADTATTAGPEEGDGHGPVLRRPAPRRVVRRRRADSAAAADLPAPVVPGYARDRRGTWRYAATGEAVPGARDVTLRALWHFPRTARHVLVPLFLARNEPDLAWCLNHAEIGTARSGPGGAIETVLRVPLPAWDRHADVPLGLWAPELEPRRLLDADGVAVRARVTRATIASYLARGDMPPPVARLGNSPVWSLPVIRAWLATRPGQGRKSRR